MKNICWARNFTLACIFEACCSVERSNSCRLSWLPWIFSFRCLGLCQSPNFERRRRFSIWLTCRSSRESLDPSSRLFPYFSLSRNPSYINWDGEKKFSNLSFNFCLRIWDLDMWDTFYLMMIIQLNKILPDILNDHKSRKWLTWQFFEKLCGFISFQNKI